MKIKSVLFLLFLIPLSSCTGVGSKGFFGTGVSVAFDPRTVGTQIDDSIMEKNFTARMLLKNKKYFKGRKILICKEMTKFYEEFFREEIDNLKILERRLKGELTIVISEMQLMKNASQKLSESDKNIIKKTINKLSVKEIIDLITKNNDISKKEIYNYCIKLKNEN